MNKEDSGTNLLHVIFWTVGILLIALFMYFYVIPSAQYGSGEANLYQWTKLDVNKFAHDYGLQEKSFLDANITEQSIFNKVNISSINTGRGNEKSITIGFSSDKNSTLRVITEPCFNGHLIFPQFVVNKNYSGNIKEEFLLINGKATVIVENATDIYKFYILNGGVCG
jgi:hypothetical protein